MKLKVFIYYICLRTNYMNYYNYYSAIYTSKNFFEKILIIINSI